MKTLSILFGTLLVCLSASGQSQGVSLRATNGVAFGTLTAQGNINATNTGVTNKLSGRVEMGKDNVASSLGAVAYGQNNRSAAQNSIAGGSNNTNFGLNSLSIGLLNSVQSSAPNSITSGSRNSASGANVYIGGESNISNGKDTFLHGKSITMNGGLAGTDNDFIAGKDYVVDDGCSNTFIWSGSYMPLVDGSFSDSFLVHATNRIYFTGAAVESPAGFIGPFYGSNLVGSYVGVVGTTPYIVSNLWSVVLPDGATAFQLGNPGAGYASIFATNLIITPDGLHYTLFTDGTNSFFGGDLYLTNSTFHGKSFRPTKVAMTIVGATAQSTNLMEIQGGSSNVLAYVDKDGIFTGNGAGLTNVAYEVNIKDFGALGDSTANDTSAIQAAIDTAKTNTVFLGQRGVRVRIPPGRYLVNKLNLWSGVELVGDARDDCILLHTNTSGDVLSFIATNSNTITDQVAVKNLTIEQAPSVNHTSGAGIVAGAPSGKAGKLTLDNVLIQGVWNGICMTNCDQSSFNNVWVVYAFSDAFVVDHCNEFNAYGCRASNPGISGAGNGFTIYSCSYSSLYSCEAEQATGSAFYIRNNGSAAVHLFGCSSEDCFYGVRSYQCTGNTLTGFYFRPTSNTVDGILLDTTTNQTMTGVSFGTDTTSGYPTGKMINSANGGCNHHLQLLSYNPVLWTNGLIADASVFSSLLSYTNSAFTNLTANGSINFSGSTTASHSLGLALDNTFTHGGRTYPTYGLNFQDDSALGGTAMALSAYWGIKFFTAQSLGMTMLSTGKVGIGVTNPATALDVTGDINLNETAGITSIGAFPANTWTYNGKTFKTLGMMLYNDSVLGGDSLALSAYWGIKFLTGQADAMTILNTGQVGIGKTNPAAKLDVAGAIHSGVTNTTTPALVSLGTNNAVLRCPDGGSWILRVGNDGTLSTVTNSTGL